MRALAPNAGRLQATFRVTSLEHAAETARLIGATHAVSFLDPSCPEERHPRLAAESTSHRKYVFYDQETGPAMTRVEQVMKDYLSFVRTIPNAPETRFLLHCHLGASRSPAACYVSMASFLGPGGEDEAFARLLDVTEKPWPNLAMVSYADEILGRGGRLLQPLTEYRKRHPNRLRAYRVLNRRRGLISPVSRNG